MIVAFDAAGGGLPTDDPCWSYTAPSGVAAPANVKGAVRIGPTTTNGLAYFARDLAGLDFALGASATARVRVVTSNYYAVFPFKRTGFYLSLRDDVGRWASLGIAADRILLSTADQNWSDQTYMVNTTTGFRDYQLVFAGNVVQARIDGETVLTAAVGTLPPNQADVLVGDLSLLGASQTFTASIVVEGTLPCAPADLNCDGSVNAADLAILLGAWGPATCGVDLNGDGSVDAADLAILLGAWSL